LESVGDTKVDQFDISCHQEEIGRLQIRMNNT
jgi:hypothetical protein